MRRQGLASLAKLNRPTSSGIAPRQRLFRLFDQKRSHPVIWITGPPGSGKTSLVSSYLDVRKLPCLWYQVDEGDADIASFFYHLGLAARKAAPRRGRPLPLLTPEYLQGIPAFTRRFFEDLYQRLLDSSTQFIIVLDNYQEVAEDSPLHEVICEACSQVPDGMNIILISRKNPPDVYVRLKANRLIELIGWKELRFTLDESRGMVRLLGHKSMPLQVLRQLHEKTDGWAAGIVLLMEGMKAKAGGSIVPEIHISEDLFHYFAKEVFDKTQPEDQAFLLKTSLFQRMSSRMAEDLTGTRGSQQILSDLTKKSYFTQRHESEKTLYQYHPLFRKFLQILARQTFDSTTFASLERGAAAILEINGQIEYAVNLLTTAKAWPGVIALILKHAPGVMSQGRGQTLEGWIRDLPESVVEETPLLLYWLGMCKMPFSPAESVFVFERAFDLFQSRGDISGTFLAWSGVVDSLFLGASRFASLDCWINWLDERVGSGSLSLPPEIEAGLACSMSLVLLWRRPHHPDIRKRVERALFLTRESADITLRLKACNNAVNYYIWMGEPAQCHEIVEEMLEMARSRTVSPLATIWSKGILSLYLSTYDVGTQQLPGVISEGLKMADETGVHVLDSPLLASAVYDSFNKGDLRLAGTFLATMSKAIERDPFISRGLYQYLKGWDSFFRGNIPAALAGGEKFLETAVEMGAPVPEMVGRLFLAILSSEIGEWEKATTHLALGREINEKMRSLHLGYLFDLLGAHLAFERGEDAAGMASLRAAFETGRRQGFRTMVLFWRPKILSRLCARALGAGVEDDYVRDLIGGLHLEPPDNPPSESESWPWALKIYTLGRFELLKDGDAIQFPVRSPRRVLLLLKALIAFGRNGASEQELMDVLWPDADGDTAKQAFDTTLHRLRLLLGNEKILQLRDSHLRLDSGYCMVDSHAFEQILEEAEATGSISLFGKALDLYQGAFLVNEPGEPWAVSYRERLRSKFLRAIRRIGCHLDENGQKEKAIEYYHRGLEVDSLAEEFYQQLMICYQSEGRRAEGLATYNRCRNVFQSVLGIEPSAKTRAICAAILQNKRIGETANQ